MGTLDYLFGFRAWFEWWRRIALIYQQLQLILARVWAALVTSAGTQCSFHHSTNHAPLLRARRRPRVRPLDNRLTALLYCTGPQPTLLSPRYENNDHHQLGDLASSPPPASEQPASFYTEDKGQQRQLQPSTFHQDHLSNLANQTGPVSFLKEPVRYLCCRVSFNII